MVGPGDAILRIIFLDIDGVLNSTRSFCAVIRKNWTNYTERIVASQDPIATRMIERLAQETNSDIVLTSSQRKPFFTGKAERLCNEKGERFVRWEHNLNELHAHMQMLGFLNVEKFISCTPDFGGEIRGVEIREWLARCNEVIDSYVIIDDDRDFLPEQMNNFVHSSNTNGFSFENFQASVKILTKGETKDA